MFLLIDEENVNGLSWNKDDKEIEDGFYFIGRGSLSKEFRKSLEGRDEVEEREVWTGLLFLSLLYSVLLFLLLQLF